ncbi:DNA-directed RNA polymerase subunit omega [Sulfurimonas sp.]|jgi:DNA-directed RNA polymerase subunit omega|uniref:DNA-directed RNA polymerase subunit omega n=1 Tax=Sulfurimonas sp. TaxID=2022749 RepID=UPI0025E1D795|nr:DNA-directed RNA polymerase subunit omega [Sulfurimonas sp.]MCK9473384.1 DNA-directed RNA polymerase subunit omega [Sulfurimonas sp.]MDD3506253.1 DNA-directed RNA polymerase subunit omega [Sulfurimonas sp.]
MRIEEVTAKILDNNPSMDRYQLAIAVSKRTDELLNGATSKLSVAKNVKVADLALMEIAEGLIIIKGFTDNKK